jgi:hypothetical protein
MFHDTHNSTKPAGIDKANLIQVQNHTGGRRRLNFGQDPILKMNNASSVNAVRHNRKT